MKDAATEARFDFRGGINLGASQDSVDPHELLQCTNARVLPSGAVQRRPGWNKKHTTTLGAGGPVLGVASLGNQAVAIANGKLYWSTDGMVTWTQVTPGAGALSTTFQADFATFLQPGNIPTLFIASGGALYTWDGTTLTYLVGTKSAPQASVVRAYGERIFVANATNTLWWSKIGDGTDFGGGGLSGGGNAVVGVGVSDVITNLEVVGSSLLIGTPTGIARFTGVGADIQIDTDTFGVNPELGPVNDGGASGYTRSLLRVGDVAMMMTPTGPYVVTESGATALTEKLQAQGGADTTVQWQPGINAPAMIGHNPVRQEAWFVYQALADASPKTALVYNYALQCWYGPMQYPNRIRSLGTVRVSGVDKLVAGCQDGFVRGLDDTPVQSSDDGGDYTHTVRLAPTTLGAGPQVTKSLRSVFVQQQRGNTATLPVVQVVADGAAPTATALVSTDGAVGTPTDMRYDTDAQGKRFVLQWSGAVADGFTNDLPMLHGVVFRGSVMDRW